MRTRLKRKIIIRLIYWSLYSKSKMQQVFAAVKLYLNILILTMVYEYHQELSEKQRINSDNYSQITIRYIIGSI